VGQLGELKRVRWAVTSPPTLSTVPGRGSAGRAEASPSGGDESADVVDRTGSWVSRGAEVNPSGGIETADAAVRVESCGTAERPFAGAWVRQP